MDSISQFTLGASIGLALGGKKYGNKAARWGGFLGTLPDLDVFIGPLLYSNPIDVELFHRGVSHSITFALIAAPLLGYIITKLHSKKQSDEPPVKGVDAGKAASGGLEDRKTRTLISFFALSTHPILDLLTSYGTQILRPFSQQRFAIDSVFIVDPLYTLPLLISLIIALIHKHKKSKIITIIVGLVLSTLYLLRSLIAQSRATTAFTTSLQDLNLDNQVDTLPVIPAKAGKGEALKVASEGLTLLTSYATPLNTFLRRGLAEDEFTYYYARRSIFDTSVPDKRYAVPKNTEILETLSTDSDIQKIITRRSPLAVKKIDESTYKLYAMRYGKLLGWEDFEDKQFMFSYTARLQDGDISLGSSWDGDQERPAFGENFLEKLLGRIF